MTTFLVRLKGRNFLKVGEEGSKRKPFYSTRLVEAANPERAEALARDLLLNDPRLKNSILNEESGQPVIYLESVIEIPATVYDAQNRANSFFWEDEESKE